MRNAYKLLVVVGGGALLALFAGARLVAANNVVPTNVEPEQTEEQPQEIQEIVVQRHNASDVVSPQADDIAITIYRDNLAFITETRTVSVPKGRSTISFAGVSDLIIPQTALLREFGAVSLERNFDYDLLSQGSLLKKSIGKTIYITRADPATGSVVEEEATIVSAGQGVVLDIDGRIEVFDCSGLPEKISFDDVPDGLRAEPTLSIEVAAIESGPQTFTISYLASGFDWQADYILRLSDEDGKADLAGWLTVTNGTSISIKEAPTGIVAGELRRLWETRAEAVNADYFFAACWPKGSTKSGARRKRSMRARRFSSAPAMLEERAFSAIDIEADEVLVTGSMKKRQQAKREDLGDYKLFRTPEPTTVAAYQTKQVSFLNKNGVDITRIHAFEREPYEVDEYDQGEIALSNATLRYDIDNEKDGVLGEPLPSGTVRVMSSVGEAGSFYLGQGDVRDLAVGLPVEVEIAQSPSVVLETIVQNISNTKLANGTRRYTAVLKHTAKNANSYPVLSEVSENKAGYSGPVKINRASRKQVAGSAYPKWQFTVPAYGVAELSYTMVWTDY